MSGQVSPQETYSGIARGGFDIYSYLFTGMKANPGAANLVFQRALFIIQNPLLNALTFESCVIIGKQIACQQLTGTT
jgi:hypothetical protein